MVTPPLLWEASFFGLGPEEILLTEGFTPDWWTATRPLCSVCRPSLTVHHDEGRSFVECLPHIPVLMLVQRAMVLEGEPPQRPSAQMEGKVGCGGGEM